MSGGTDIVVKPVPTDKAQPDSGFLGQWTGWVGVAKAIATRGAGFIRYGLHAQSSSQRPLLDMQASNQQLQSIRTAEKEYRFNDNGRMLKRSLRKNELPTFGDGTPLVPPLIVERLKNEAACIEFIREKTDVPVPRLLETYEEDGSFFLWMEYVEGIEMSQLAKEQQQGLLPQSKYHLRGLPKVLQ